MARALLAAEVVDRMGQAASHHLCPHAVCRRPGEERVVGRRHPLSQLRLAREQRLWHRVATKRRLLEALRRRRFVEFDAAEELRFDWIALAPRLLVLGGAGEKHFARTLLADDETPESIGPPLVDGDQADKEAGQTVEVA